MAKLASQATMRAWYTTYSNDEWFEKRAALVRGRVSTGKVLVVGCGLGFLVQRLVEAGIDAYGCDASAWALSQASAGVATRLKQADALVATQMNGMLTFAGMKGTQRFTLVITEDLLPCAASNAEANAMLTNCRAVSTGSTSALHLLTSWLPTVGLTPASDPSVLDKDLLWKTLPDWQTFCAPDLVLECRPAGGY